MKRFWPFTRWYLVAALGAAAILLAGVLLLRRVEESASPGVVVAMQTTIRGDVTLEIEVSHLKPGEDYRVRLASAADGNPGASVGWLGQLTAEESGVGILTASRVTVAAGAEIPLQAEMFHAPGGLLSIIAPDGVVAAEVRVFGGTR